MGAAEKLDPEMTAFFQNEKIILEKKTKALAELRQNLMDSVDLDNSSFDESVIKLKAYCEITEQVHMFDVKDEPNKVMPGWGNMKLASIGI